MGFLEGKPTLFLSFLSVSNNPTGQITLNASVDQSQQPEQAPEVAINVIEDDSVTFRCQAITQTPTLNFRLPGSSFFGTTQPSNLRIIDSLTYEFQTFHKVMMGLRSSVVVGQVLLTSVSSSCCVSRDCHGFCVSCVYPRYRRIGLSGAHSLFSAHRLLGACCLLTKSV